MSASQHGGGDLICLATAVRQSSRNRRCVCESNCRSALGPTRRFGRMSGQNTPHSMRWILMRYGQSCVSFEKPCRRCAFLGMLHHNRCFSGPPRHQQSLVARLSLLALLKLWRSHAALHPHLLAATVYETVLSNTQQQLYSSTSTPTWLSPSSATVDRSSRSLSCRRGGVCRRTEYQRLALTA